MIPSNLLSGSTAESDVNFYDYDGTIIQSYTKQKFLALKSMPENPVHEGLTAQGWNWELEDAKTYVETYGKLNIGQMYVTSDGKTRIYVHMEDGRLNPQLNLTFAEAGSFTVDWGDGTTPDTINGDADTLGTIAHTYADPGDYVIAVTVDSGKVSIIGTNNYTQLFKKTLSSNNNENKVYSNCIKAIKLGSGVTSIGSYAFNNCYSLISVTIPSGVINIEDGAFSGCFSLTSITIPSGVTNIGSSAFYNCHLLKLITMPSGVTSIGNAFDSCYSLKSITIPSGVTSIVAYTFRYCYSLTSVTIPDSVTSIGMYAFSRCQSLKSITIPDGVTSIGEYAFQYCSSLMSIIIPGEVTIIDSSTFYGCASLTSITIPSKVTNIYSQAFYDCQGLGYLRFTSENSVPSISASNTFQNLPTDCIIYVPPGKLELYKTQYLYPNPSTYTYQEYTEA